MPWVRIDEEFPEHPKLLKAGPLAMLMQVAALCYCNRHLTDGFIPEAKVPTLINLDGLGDWRDVLSALLREGIWRRVDGGYQIHDYLNYQPSREQVLAEREQKREAGRKGGQASAQARAQAGAQADGQAPAQAESKPVPVPAPVPERNTKLSPSETATQSVAAAKGPSIEEVNNQRLIAELVAEYRTIEGVEPKNGDYPFIGSLYNQYGYEQVLCGINALRQAMAVDPIQKPLVYLKGIVKREVEGIGTHRRHPGQAQPAKPGKYAGLLRREVPADGPGPDGGRGPPAWGRH